MLDATEFKISKTLNNIGKSTYIEITYECSNTSKPVTTKLIKELSLTGNNELVLNINHCRSCGIRHKVRLYSF